MDAGFVLIGSLMDRFNGAVERQWTSIGSGTETDGADLPSANPETAEEEVFSQPLFLCLPLVLAPDADFEKKPRKNRTPRRTRYTSSEDTALSKAWVYVS